MVAKEMREVLDNVLFQDLSEEIQKLSVPGSVHVRVVIETIDEPASLKADKAENLDYQFLEKMQELPVSNDLPEDLAHQHDHYLYGLPKK